MGFWPFSNDTRSSGTLRLAVDQLFMKIALFLAVLRLLKQYIYVCAVEDPGLESVWSVGEGE